MLGAFRGIFGGCVPSFDNSAWNTLNSINYMHLHRFFRGVFQVKVKSPKVYRKCAFMRIYAERIMGVYMCVLFLYTITIIFLEHLEHISKY